MAGIRFDRGAFRMAAGFRQMARDWRTESFLPEMRTFAKKSLKTASEMTPSRSIDLIRQNQRRQYDLRVNCIPSSHDLVNPSLRVKKSGEHWLFMDGKWYHANKWHLQPPQWAAYRALLAERDRRMQTAKDEFIKARAQARYLYKKVWHQAAESLGIPIGYPGPIRIAHSRHNPPRDPPRGYGQWRGGGATLNAVIRFPFLLQPSRYISFNANEILARAQAKHRPEFEAQVRARGQRIVAAGLSA